MNLGDHLKHKARVLVCDPIDEKDIMQLKQAGFHIDEPPIRGELKKLLVTMMH